MKKIIYWIIGIVVFTLLVWYGLRVINGFIDKEATSRSKIIYDTNTTARLKQDWKADTVILWRDKILYKQSDPKIIYVQSDSLVRENLRNKDLMISLKKENDILRIFAHNSEDSVIKEYFFEGVNRDFTATAMTGNIMVKSQKFYWNGISAESEIGLNLNDLSKYDKINSYTKTISLSTGWNYEEKIGFDVGVKYDFDLKNYSLLTKLKFTIK